jgi:putative transposase
MLLKIACLLMRWLLGLTVLVVRGDRAKNAELLVLQHENAVLRRNVGTVRDLGRVSAHCSGKSEEPESRTSAWLPAWLPATLDAWHVGALVLVTTTCTASKLVACCLTRYFMRSATRLGSTR